MIRIAEGTLHIAAGKPDEHRRVARVVAFSLKRVKYFAYFLHLNLVKVLLPAARGVGFIYCDIAFALLHFAAVAGRD